MSKASESALAALHGAVAVALTDAVQGTEVDGAKVPASAAHIMAAITFLKNNSITADAESNGDLLALNKALADKRAARKGALSRSLIDDAAATLERDLGDFMQ